MTSSISTLRATTARFCRWRWLFSVMTIDVSPWRGSSSNRVTLAAASTVRLMTSAPPLISTSPGTASRSFAAAGRGSRKFSTCRAAVVSSGATMSSVNSCRPIPVDEQHQSPGGVASDRGVLLIERGVFEADAAEVQRQGVQAVFENVDGQHASDFRPLRRGRDGVVGRNDQRGLRGVGFRRLLRLLQQIFIFLAAQQHPFRLLLQEHVQVGEGDVDGALASRRGLLVGDRPCVGDAQDCDCDAAIIQSPRVPTRSVGTRDFALLHVATLHFAFLYALVCPPSWLSGFGRLGGRRRRRRRLDRGRRRRTRRNVRRPACRRGRLHGRRHAAFAAPHGTHQRP